MNITDRLNGVHTTLVEVIHDMTDANADVLDADHDIIALCNNAADNVQAAWNAACDKGLDGDGDAEQT